MSYGRHKGQTKEMIAHDIDCLKRYFKLGTVNVYNNNTTPIKRDEELVRWFMKEYNWLLDVLLLKYYTISLISVLGDFPHC